MADSLNKYFATVFTVKDEDKLPAVQGKLKNSHRKLDKRASRLRMLFIWTFRKHWIRFHTKIKFNTIANGGFKGSSLDTNGCLSLKSKSV